jgi:hypothetical protein
MKILNILFIITVILTPLNADAQIKNFELKEVKNLLAGNWSKDRKVTTFTFENDSTGTWKTENIISTAPLFIIYKESEIWYLGRIDLLGSGEPYAFEIITLTRKKLIIQDKTKDTLLKYKRK